MVDEVNTVTPDVCANPRQQRTVAGQDRKAAMADRK